MEISFDRILALIINKLKYILLIALVAVIATFIISESFVSKSYTSSADIYINMNSQTDQNTITELNTTKNLVTNYIAILNTNNFFEKVANAVNEELSTFYTGPSLKSRARFSTKSVELNTSIFVITFADESPAQAQQILSIISREAANYINSNPEDFPNPIVVTDGPTFSSRPTSPDTLNNCIYVFLASVILSIFVFVILEVVDNKVKDVQSVVSEFQLSLLGVIPDYAVQTNNKNSKNGFLNSLRRG